MKKIVAIFVIAVLMITMMSGCDLDNLITEKTVVTSETIEWTMGPAYTDEELAMIIASYTGEDVDKILASMNE